MKKGLQVLTLSVFLLLPFLAKAEFNAKIYDTYPKYLLKTDQDIDTRVTVFIQSKSEPMQFFFDGHPVGVSFNPAGSDKVFVEIPGDYLGRAQTSQLIVCEGTSADAPCSVPYDIRICSNDAACTPSAAPAPAPAPRETPTDTTPTVTTPVATAPAATPPAGPTFAAQSTNPESGGCSFSAALPSNISLGLFASFFLQISGLALWRLRK